MGAGTTCLFGHVVFRFHYQHLIQGLVHSRPLFLHPKHLYWVANVSQAICWMRYIMANKSMHDPCPHGAYKLAGETHINQTITLHWADIEIQPVWLLWWEVLRDKGKWNQIKRKCFRAKGPVGFPWASGRWAEFWRTSEEEYSMRVAPEAKVFLVGERMA